MNSISYIIPCYKSERTIGQCLEAIFCQKGSFKKEIIIIDSSPNKLVWEQLKKHSNEIVYISSTKQLYAGLARNLGLEQAKGDYISFIDSDVVINDQWTLKMIALYKKLENKYLKEFIISGAIINSPRTNTYVKNSLFFMEFYRMLPFQNNGFRKVIQTNNIFLRHSSIKNTNTKFSAIKLAEDVLFSEDFIKDGGFLYFDATNVVEHITYHKVFKHFVCIGSGAANYRLNSHNILNRTLFFLILPIIAPIKLISVILSLVRKPLLIVYYLPMFFIGVLFYAYGVYLEIFLIKYEENYY